MHFSAITLPLLALITSSTAVTVSIRAFHGKGCDLGGSTYRANVAAKTCFDFKNSFGVRFTGMPASAQGQIYRDTACNDFGESGGAGTYCLDKVDYINSANWFYKSSRLVRKEAYTESHTGVTYRTPSGELRNILCREKDFDYVLGLVNAEDWEALEEYEDDLDAPALV